MKKKTAAYYLPVSTIEHMDRENTSGKSKSEFMANELEAFYLILNNSFVNLRRKISGAEACLILEAIRDQKNDNAALWYSGWIISLVNNSRDFEKWGVNKVKLQATLTACSSLEVYTLTRWARQVWDRYQDNAGRMSEEAKTFKHRPFA